MRSILRRHLGIKVQLQFAEQLLSLLESGLPLLNAIELLQQVNGSDYSHFLPELYTKLKQGNSLTQSLLLQGELFSAEFINLIRVSERTGDLELALRTITRQLSAKIELNNQIRQALTYPIITLLSSIFLLLVMMIWVIPVFKEVFANFRAELPPATAMLIATSDLIQEFFLLILLLGLCGVGIFIFFWVRSIRLQKLCDLASFQIPLFGNLLRLATLSNWCRTLGHLLHSGLALPDAIRITAQSSNHWLSHDLSAELFKHLTRGWPLRESLNRSDPHHYLFDQETLQLLSIGAESASLAKMLNKRAEVLQTRLSSQLNTLGQTIEPLLMIGIGLIIGALVVILYLPIFNLGQVV
ncbi:type II secretion system F family protein [Polynucleobacter sp. MWH-P3-07-1]|uniref:type II secretion system F family protein n=1 Tax=Polynucleobacter sp. MWH-P3-07-1 TaxID=1743173 RepID=UPI001BFEB4F5|nr:type II secretion system F family protein [Polynucleobacter sp. MWH-P3-07-1]QWD83681.1 type II secretion system F family protein [Polynucleobacter sp. MWH-P3-07-1]